MKRKGRILLVVCFALGPARADEIPELRDFVAAGIEATAPAVAAAGASPGALPHGWHFARFALRLQARAGFTVTAAGKIELVPEVELVWRKKAPVEEVDSCRAH